jgi:putative nucleotidyltransferase with HDIG domain
MVAYLMVLVSLATGLAAWLIVSEHQLGSGWIVAALAILAAAAERGNIHLSRTVQVSVSALPTLFAAIALGPLAAMIVSTASMCGDFAPPYMKWAIHTSTRALSGGLTGLVATAAASLSTSNIGSIAISTTVAVIANQLLDLGFAAITVHLRRSGSGLAVIQTFLPVMASSVLLWVAVIAPLVIAYTELSPWAVVLFLFPALAAQRLFSMYQEQRRLATDLAAANQSLERANLSFASALVTTLDARDRYTAGHSAAVAVYARDIAAELGLPIATQQLAHLSGLLHDIGKIGVPPGILEKNGPLTLPERRKMEAHSVIGERILANVEAYTEIATIVRYHHERIDGEGYPDGIAGTQIPVISRIICVADAYNAMTSDRPYRDAMPVATAQAVLTNGAGTQFDQDVVTAFLHILGNASESYSIGARADFAVEAQAHPELGGVTAATAA